MIGLKCKALLSGGCKISGLFLLAELEKNVLVLLCVHIES